MSPATNIAGWTLQLNIRQGSTVILQATPPTINNATVGIFTFVLTSTQTGSMTTGNYLYDIWRTDSGFETQLVYGGIYVSPEEWK